MVTTVWQLQGGTINDDGFNALAMGSDASSLLAGFANINETAATTYWTAMKIDADGTILWTWQDEVKGDDGDLLYGAAMSEDGLVALAGTAGNDFQVIMLDADGSFMWRFQDGSGYRDYGDGIAVGDDGSIVVAGGTGGEWNIPNIGDWDMAAFKLDADGNLVWKWQNGTAQTDSLNNLAMGDDGSVVLTGSSSGNIMGVDAIGSESSSFTSAASEPNFIAVKLDSEGAEVWRWQDGPRGEDNRLMSVIMVDDGSTVLAGRATGVWGGDTSAGALDFIAVKLDADGNEVWRWQDGTSGDDSLSAVALRNDGTFVFGGYTLGDWNGSNAGGSDFAVVALDDDGEEIWRWQGGSASSGDESGDDYMNDISASSEGTFVFGGKTYGSWAATNLGKGDFVAAMIDIDASATPSPTPTRFDAAPTVRPANTPDAALTPTATQTGSDSDLIPIIAGVASALLGFVLILTLGICLWKKHVASRNDPKNLSVNPVAVGDKVDIPPPLLNNPSPSPPPSYSQAMRAATTHVERGRRGTDNAFTDNFAGRMNPTIKPTAGESKKNGYGDGATLGQTWHTDQTGAGRGDGYGHSDGSGGLATVEGKAEPIMRAELAAEGGRSGRSGGGRGCGGDGGNEIEKTYAVDGSLRLSRSAATSTVMNSTDERSDITAPIDEEGVGGAVSVADGPQPAFDELGDVSSADTRASSSCLRLGQVVGDAAKELARNCHIPGVCEAAVAVSILVNLVTNTGDCKSGTETGLRRCRSIVSMLQRAAKVLGKGGDTTGKAERALMEDVHDAVFDLVELIKTYQSKNKLSQVLMSTLFRRRQDEMSAVVDRAILNLQLGLHVQVGNDVSAFKHDLGAFKDDMSLCQGSIEEAQSKYMAEARKERRRRKLDQIEIAEDDVTITDELLGKGGFAEVYLADYNGRNAAAKVLYITSNLCRRSEKDVLDGSIAGQDHRGAKKSQRRSFLRELDTMTRLRSPYTVNVHGAVTGLPDRLVLVMELLAGGDLGTLLRNCEHPLAEQQARQIIGDVCAGMVFLHSKEAIHGDMKSANVLLDGAGRAKIGDFGTSRWTHHTMSTGLATFTAESSQSTQLSLAWSAPEVLHAGACSYASDVYSFGIVVWEVLSREVPWATETHPREIYIRVVLNDLRPAIPDDAPPGIADMVKACLVAEPGDRPSFSTIMEGIKSKGWNE